MRRLLEHLLVAKLKMHMKLVCKQEHSKVIIDIGFFSLYLAY